MIQPIHDNVLVSVKRQEKVEAKTQSGIILTTKNQVTEKPTTGYVYAVGEGRYLANGNLVKPSIHKGDKVIFNRYAGTEIEDEESGQLFVLMKENDIIAIINDK